MKNKIMEIILKILTGDFALVTDGDEAAAWRNNQWNNPLVMTDSAGANELYNPLEVLDSDKPVIITVAGLKIMRDRLSQIEEERDSLKDDMAAIKRAQEIIRG